MKLSKHVTTKLKCVARGGLMNARKKLTTGKQHPPGNIGTACLILKPNSYN